MSNEQPRTPAPWIVTHDDTVIFTASTEGECWRWLHRHQPASIDHAIRYEGYRILGATGQEPFPA